MVQPPATDSRTPPSPRGRDRSFAREFPVMRPEQLLPTIMILLSVGSAIGYLCIGDARRTIYWAAAAVLTASVTF